MATQEKWKLDRKLTAMMVEDMLFDPILAAKVLLRADIPPHEELRLMWMWTKYYTNDDSGFSTGKSWTLALVAALRSMLLKDRVSGIISGSFRQGKLIFQNFDRWYNTSPIFRSCIRHAAGKVRLVHASDVWSAHFRGGSEIRVLPPSFAQDAERIRSERWNDAYLDEWTTYGNFTALNKTIIGRVTRVNRFQHCPVRQNHIHLASTPSFKHHPAYDLVKNVDQQISRGNTDYGHFTCNYRHVPNLENYDWLVSRKVIFHMQSTMPKGMVTAEIDGKWSEDSGTYYNSKIVEAIRFGAIPVCLERKNQNEIYIAGCDVAPGGGDSKSGGQGDDFAISVFRKTPQVRTPHHVLTIRLNRVSDVVMSGIIHKINKKLQLSLLVIDPGGGGLFLQDKLRLMEQYIDFSNETCMPIVTPTDATGTMGNAILCMFSRSDFYIGQAWHKMSSDSVLVNRAHNEFKGAIENKNVILSGRWEGWDGNEASWDVAAKRKWLNNRPHLKEEDRCRAEMDLAVNQLIQVDCERDKEGKPILDKYGMYSFSSDQKKDAAYSLLYGFSGTVIFDLLLEHGIVQAPQAFNNAASHYAAVTSEV